MTVSSSAPFDTAVTDKLLTTTRAVRKRLDLDRPVEREVILDAIRLAQQAPTGSNSQSWRWVIVTDPDKRAALSEIYRAVGNEYMRDAPARVGGGAQGVRVLDSSQYLLQVIDRVPALVIPCITGRLTDVGRGASFFGSIIQAAWSFQLGLRSRGLGSVYTTFHLAREREAAEILGIPYDEVTQVALLPVAYTIGTDFKPAERGPVEDITYWDTWENNA